MDIETQETREVREIRRWQVKGTMDAITQAPWRIISAYGARRGDLLLRYPPRDLETNGVLVRIGDRFPYNGELLPVQLPDGTLDPRMTIGGAGVIVDASGREYNLADKRAERRKGDKVIIEPAGTARWLQVKQWDHDNPRPTKHWTPSDDGKLHYEPLTYDLYQLQGFYNDQVKTQPNGTIMLGRYGQWRPFCQVCMRGVMVIRALGVEWRVTDPPQTEPIAYPLARVEVRARQRVTGFDGDNLIPMPLPGQRFVTTDSRRPARNFAGN